MLPDLGRLADEDFCYLTTIGRVTDQPRTIEIDPVVVIEVRVFARVHPAGVKINLTFRFIDFVDAANYPLAFSDLISRVAVFLILMPAATSHAGANVLRRVSAEPRSRWRRHMEQPVMIASGAIR